MERPLQDKLFDMRILIVDDEPGFTEIFTTLLNIYGYNNIVTAPNGAQALRILENGDNVDLVLTDMNMPEVDGYELLRRIKSHHNWQGIPVIMISGAGQLKNVIRCIGEGAEDYLMKPLEKELLWARVNASLERKYLKDREKDLFLQLETEKNKSERVLYNVVPRRIADRLRQGEYNIAEHVQSASILFTDMVSFTTISREISAERLVGILNLMFLSMDHLVDKYELEKIKTVGDSYMCAAGLEPGQDDHAQRSVDFARAAINEIRVLNAAHEVDIRIRVGVASGSLIAGIIGRVRPMFDVWGSTVNLASRMESHGVPERVQIAESTYELLQNKEGFVARDPLNVKGVGMMQPYISEVVQ